MSFEFGLYSVVRLVRLPRYELGQSSLVRGCSTNCSGPSAARCTKTDTIFVMRPFCRLSRWFECKKRFQGSCKTDAKKVVVLYNLRCPFVACARLCVWPSLDCVQIRRVGASALLDPSMFACLPVRCTQITTSAVLNPTLAR